MKTISKILSVVLCLAMVVGFFTFGASAADVQWTQKDLASIQSTDKVMITISYNGTYYALPNDFGSDTSPAGTALTATSNALTADADKYAWTLTKEGESYAISPASDSTKYLYMTSNSTKVLSVGTTKQTWTPDSGFLKNSEYDRLLGLYQTDLDFRTYANTNNFGGESIVFWVQGGSGSGSQGGGTQAPATTNYVIAAGGTVAMTGYSGSSDYYYPTGASVTISGTTVTGPKGADAIFKIAEVDGGITIQDSNGHYLSAKAGYSSVTVGSTPVVWTKSGNKLTITVDSVTRTLALDTTRGSFGAYTADQLTSDHVSELTFVANPTWVDKVEEMTIAQILEANSTGTAYKTTGVVTYINGKNVYIQDGDAGLCLYFSTAPTDLALGDTVTAEGAYKVYNGLPELDAVKNYSKGTSQTLPSDVTTLGALTTDDICTYVTIKNLTVSIKSGNTYLTDGTTELQWYKIVLPDGVTLADGDTVAEFKGAVGVYQTSLQLVNTLGTEITLCAHGDVEWKVEESKHYQECADCGAKLNECSGEIETKNDENQHWTECKTCDYETTKTNHADGNDADELCDTCSYDMACPHTTMASKAENGEHWLECSCGYTVDHTDKLSVKSDATHHWTECGAEGCTYVSEKAEHNMVADYEDQTGHWTECTECGYKTDKVAHSLSDGKCACGYEKVTTGYFKVTNGKLTSGKYIMVIGETGYAAGVLDGTWVSAVQPTISGNQVVNPEGCVWTLTVDGSKVTITDENGKTIYNNGKTNMIEDSTAWNWKYEDGKFYFYTTVEEGSNPRYFSSSPAESGANRWRAYYQTIEPDSYGNFYYSGITLYKLSTSGSSSSGGNANTADNSVISVAIAAAVLSVLGTTAIILKKKGI